VVGEPVKRWKCAYKACEALCCRMERELTLKDIREISKAAGKKVEDFVQVKPNRRGAVPFTLKRKRGRCVFLQENFQCQLHPLGAKPSLCRIYPFLLSRVIYGDEPILEVRPAQDCPGIGRGPRFGEEAVKTVAESAKNYLEGLREVVKLSRRGLKPEEILEKLEAA